MSLKLLPVSFTCILQQIVSTGRRVKTPAVMGSRAFIYFFLPSHPVVEFHHLRGKPLQPLCSFHFGPLALFPYLLFLSLPAHRTLR